MHQTAQILVRRAVDHGAFHKEILYAGISVILEALVQNSPAARGVPAQSFLRSSP
jgi:hypothetical protein